MRERIKRNAERVTASLVGTDAYAYLSPSAYSLMQVLRRRLAESVHGRVLDVGAGDGTYARLLRRTAHEVVTLDVDPQQRQRVDIVGDAEQLPVADTSFDTVISTQVLEHLAHPQRAIAEAYRVLRPGGNYIVTVPHLAYLHNEPHDYFRFTTYGLRTLLEDAGFTVTSVEPVGGLCTFLGHVYSVVVMGVVGTTPVLAPAVRLVHRIPVRLSVWLDRLFHTVPLLPCNYVAIATKQTSPAS